MFDIKQDTQIDKRYTLKEFKGRGSFGEVWRAHDELIGEDVAIKFYVSLNPSGMDDFKKEYLTTRNLSHTNLLRSEHFAVWEGHPYLVMKYCERGSISSQAGNMSERTVWAFIRDVAAGLAYLHERNIIHQDIKPDNILVDNEGRCLVSDFGISKQLRATMMKQSGLTSTAGAVSYMGPERFEKDPTPIKASDIWSLGASIYELVIGELPFCGMGGVMLKNGSALPELNSSWSKELNAVMQACLAKDTWERPTASQLEQYARSVVETIDNGRTIPQSFLKPNEGTGDTPKPKCKYRLGRRKKQALIKLLNCILLILIVGLAIMVSLKLYRIGVNTNLL